MKEPGAERELLIGAANEAAKHRNVVPLLDDGEHDNNWVMVMPRADRSLAQHLNDSGGSLSVEETLVVLTDIATALSDINGSLVHRDLKPQNVLLLNGTWSLADFGISRYAEASTSPDTRKYSLTAQYAAPDQGQRGDIGARGHVLQIDAEDEAADQSDGDDCAVEQDRRRRRRDHRGATRRWIGSMPSTSRASSLLADGARTSR
ncbi:protein kinase, partial [Mycolicibacterium vaccae]|nr:protein kinase [Mycolicibacterium vaccae]